MQTAPSLAPRTVSVARRLSVRPIGLGLLRLAAIVYRQRKVGPQPLLQHACGVVHLRLPVARTYEHGVPVMNDDARIGRIQTDGGPMFGVEVCSGAARSWVTLTGELDLASAPHLQQVLDQLCRDDLPEVVLDLSGLNFLSVVGLGVFLRADDQLRAAGGRLILHRPGRLARRILAITQLDTVLAIQPATVRSLDRTATSGIGEVS